MCPLAVRWRRRTVRHNPSAPIGRRGGSRSGVVVHAAASSGGIGVGEEERHSLREHSRNYRRCAVVFG
ncbi:hypothetical protein ACSQ67_008874 [Phaseolus vulgaris]